MRTNKKMTSVVFASGSEKQFMRRFRTERERIRGRRTKTKCIFWSLKTAATNRCCKKVICKVFSCVFQMQNSNLSIFRRFYIFSFEKYVLQPIMMSGFFVGQFWSSKSFGTADDSWPALASLSVSVVRDRSACLSVCRSRRSAWLSAL